MAMFVHGGSRARVWVYRLTFSYFLLQFTAHLKEKLGTFTHRGRGQVLNVMGYCNNVRAQQHRILLPDTGGRFYKLKKAQSVKGKNMHIGSDNRCRLRFTKVGRGSRNRVSRREKRGEKQRDACMCTVTTVGALRMRKKFT